MRETFELETMNDPGKGDKMEDPMFAGIFTSPLLNFEDINIPNDQQLNGESFIDGAAAPADNGHLVTADSGESSISDHGGHLHALTGVDNDNAAELRQSTPTFSISDPLPEDNASGQSIHPPIAPHGSGADNSPAQMATDPFDFAGLGGLCGSNFISDSPQVYGPTLDHNIALHEQGYNTTPITDDMRRYVQAALSMRYTAEEIVQQVTSGMPHLPPNFGHGVPQSYHDIAPQAMYGTADHTSDNYMNQVPNTVAPDLFDHDSSLGSVRPQHFELLIDPALEPQSLKRPRPEDYNDVQSKLLSHKKRRVDGTIGKLATDAIKLTSLDSNDETLETTLSTTQVPELPLHGFKAQAALPRVPKRSRLAHADGNDEDGSSRVKTKKQRVDSTIGELHGEQSDNVLSGHGGGLSVDGQPVDNFVAKTCNIPRFVKDPSYTSPTPLLKGYSLENLPSVCGVMITLKQPPKVTHTLKYVGDSNRVMIGPRGKALREIHKDFPDQISSHPDHIWKAVVLLHMFPYARVGDIRARMIWNFTGSALSNRMETFRSGHGMFSLEKSEQRSAPKVEVEIVHKLSEDQMNRNTGWELSDCKQWMRQPGATEVGWYRVPWPTADFIMAPESERLKDAMRKYNECVKECLSLGYPVTSKNVLKLIKPVRRGNKGGSDEASPEEDKQSSPQVEEEQPSPQTMGTQPSAQAQSPSQGQMDSDSSSPTLGEADAEYQP